MVEGPVYLDADDKFLAESFAETRHAGVALGNAEREIARNVNVVPGPSREGKEDVRSRPRIANHPH